MLAADVLSGVLAFVFGSAAVAKLVGQKQQVLTAEKLRISWRRYRWIAVPEAAASGLVLLIAGALTFRVRVRDSVGFLLGDATLLALAAATAALFVTGG
jgi:hypothetical protein